MNVCDNLGDHLMGNVYVKFQREEDAERAVAELNNRWFKGQAVHAGLSPVTDFRESCCRQYEMGECTHGAFCNFMHLRPISQNLRQQLYGGNPAAGPVLATDPKKGTNGIPQITSDTLAPFPSLLTGTDVLARTLPQSPLHSPALPSPGSGAP
ncbi:splicing factor U2AF 26 kDa subunit isoform X3 [Eulemur rufifrons]|uniref:splicing factor U2AF 26 kDa subunit isoform X3 n=1 Tax=Eulemur rufifrons TaxID=859984 RepID=UPI003742DDC0